MVKVEDCLRFLCAHGAAIRLRRLREPRRGRVLPRAQFCLAVAAPSK